MIVRARFVVLGFGVAWGLMLAFEALAAATDLKDALVGAVALGVGLAATAIAASMLRGTSHRGSLVSSIALLVVATVVGLAVSVGAVIYLPEPAVSAIAWIEKFLSRLSLVALGAGMLIGLFGIFIQAASGRRPSLDRRGRLLCVTGVGVTALGTSTTVALARWAASLG